MSNGQVLMCISTYIHVSLCRQYMYMLDVARQQPCIRVVCKYISESIKYGDQCTSNIIVTAPMQCCN